MSPSLLDLEADLARVMEELDAALEHDQPTDALVARAQETALASAEKRDACARFLRICQRTEEGFDAEIKLLKQRQATLSRRREWMERAILIAIQSHVGFGAAGANSISGLVHKFTAVQNPPPVEPFTMTAYEMRSHVIPTYLREKVTLDWNRVALKAALDAGKDHVPARLVEGEWRLMVT